MNEIKLVNNQLPEKLAEQLHALLVEEKRIAEQVKNIKETIKDLMEENGVLSIENDWFKIKYVEPTTSIRVNTALLKKQFEEVYLECVKESQVKSQIRITVK